MKPGPSHALVFLLLASGTPALAQSDVCPMTIPLGIDELTCTCGPGPHEFEIWGSGPYTSDSPICSAAVHAGAIGSEGGEVTIHNVEPSPDTWPGSTANGVTSLGLLAEGGSYGGGYDFSGVEERAKETEAASP